MANIREVVMTAIGRASMCWKGSGPKAEFDAEDAIAVGDQLMRDLFDGDIVPTAFKTLKASMQIQSDYAWSWHCNVAMASFDEGMDQAAANRAAARFMRMAFGVDTSQFAHYIDLMESLKNVEN